jgi:hypothetical protein
MPEASSVGFCIYKKVKRHSVIDLVDVRLSLPLFRLLICPMRAGAVIIGFMADLVRRFCERGPRHALQADREIFRWEGKGDHRSPAPERLH